MKTKILLKRAVILNSVICSMINYVTFIFVDSKSLINISKETYMTALIISIIVLFIALFIFYKIEDFKEKLKTDKDSLVQDNKKLKEALKTLSLLSIIRISYPNYGNYSFDQIHRSNGDVLPVISKDYVINSYQKILENEKSVIKNLLAIDLKIEPNTVDEIIEILYK